MNMTFAERTVKRHVSLYWFICTPTNQITLQRQFVATSNCLEETFEIFGPPCPHLALRV